MQFLVVALFFSAVVAYRSPRNQQQLSQAAAQPHAHPLLTFDQKIDHNGKVKGTFKQRYYLNETFVTAKKDIPTFIFLAGEAPMEFFEFQEVSAVHWAKQFGARYISLEHRFYGKSLPAANYATQNLVLLSVEQALSDAATFIEAQNKANSNLGKWVVFGCSYSGALSAFFREKYPHLVVGSVAPSGPVLAKSDFTGYLKHFSQVAPTACWKRIAAAANSIETLFKGGQSNYVAALFNSCNDLSMASDQKYFKFSISGDIGSSDQFENPHAGWPLNKTCDVVMRAKTDIMGWVNAIGANSGQCTDYSAQGFVKSMQDVNSQDRSWYWQKCSEFGFFKPTKGSIFFPDVELSDILPFCEQIFGIKNMSPATGAINMKYGGQQPTGSNILFTNGHFDPWSLLSVTSPYKQVDAVTYAAGHCAPMTAPQANDPPSLTVARNHVHAFLSTIV